MQPSRRKYSVTSFQSQIMSDSSLAIVRCTQADDACNNGRRPDKTPRQLIQNEALASLVCDVQQLRARCDGLEHANAELQAELQDVKRSRECSLTMRDTDSPFANAARHLNLAGYASSEASASSQTAASKDGAAVSKIDFEAFQAAVNEKIDTITEILSIMKSSLAAEGVERYKLGQELQRHQQNSANTKGRMGALEYQVREMRDEAARTALEELQRERQAQGHRAPSPPNAPGDLQYQLSTALAEIADLTLEMKDQATMMTDMQTRLDTVYATIDNVPHTTGDHVQRNSSVDAGVPSTDLASLQNTIAQMTHKAEMQQQIDDMHTKDQLHVVFTHLQQCLVWNSSGEGSLTAGSFTGSYDDLWSLRDRVVRRLTTIDKYGEVLEEAKCAEVDL